jgi:SAM-dependent methyltransferase
MHGSSDSRQSIGLEDWLQTAGGRYALAWEQAQLDRIVADIFGFHALQLGLGPLQALRCNRMAHRWLAQEGPQGPGPGASRGFVCAVPQAAPRGDGAALVCDFTDLPFATQSLDLVVLPHALELAADPHACLREVDRVLVAGGQVVITGFNALSLWGARQALARFGGPLYLPQRGELISPRRVRDWLRLLSFEVSGGRYGCYRPALCSASWLERWQFMDRAGDRWWPMLGAVYVLVATKRVRAMRLVGKAWTPARAAKAGAARPVARRRS